MENRQKSIIDFSKLKKFVIGIMRLVPVPLGLCLLNIIVQRIFQINGDVRWMVHYTSRVTTPKKIRLGEKVWLSFAVSGSCYIQGFNGIYIDDYTIFAPGVKIISANHVFGESNKWDDEVPIQIGKHCWLGANAVILPGVTLGDNCLVGAGAVVTKSFPAGSKIAGVPAKLIEQPTICKDNAI
ncbi:MAG: acyltransferase [Anaerolineales bacterium]|nr:acyltransferase [Anaerolineales bacterium]